MKTGPHKQLYLNVHWRLVVIVPNWKQTNVYQKANTWINSATFMWWNITQQLRRAKPLTTATTQMNFKITLSKRSETEGSDHLIPFIWSSSTGRTTVAEIRAVVAFRRQGRGEGRGCSCTRHYNIKTRNPSTEMWRYALSNFAVKLSGWLASNSALLSYLGKQPSQRVFLLTESLSNHATLGP